MSCCSTCAVGQPCSGEQGCAGPLGKPAYYRAVSVDGSNTSDMFQVGNNDPSQNGWVLYSGVDLGSNAQLAASLTLNAFWQSPLQLEIGRVEWSRGGVVWIPFPSFAIDFTDTESSGNTSTVNLYARPVLGGIVPSSVLYATQRASVAADNGSNSFTIPAGATSYMVAFHRSQGLAGDVHVEELNTSGGTTNSYSLVSYDDEATMAVGQASGSDFYRPVPPGPGGVIKVTNGASAGSGNACVATIRYRIDLAMAR